VSRDGELIYVALTAVEARRQWRTKSAKPVDKSVGRHS
jgi:hypothetical protein